MSKTLSDMYPGIAVTFSRIFQNKILTEIRLFAVMLDECVVQGPSICKNGKCTDLAEGYMCTCNKGYKRLDKNTCVG